MRLDPKWIETFADVFRLCGVQAGDACAVLSETQSRQAIVQLSELALASLGARWFHVVLPTPRQTAPVPVRSTGASDAIGGLAPVVQALAGSVFVADCTVEGLQHAAELPQILKGGARVLAISNEHPEILERCLYPLMNEGFRILDEGVVLRASDIDVVWTSGYGFPRYRGGPMFHAEAIGLKTLLDGMYKYRELFGPMHWEPAQLLVELVKSGHSIADWERSRSGK